MPRPSQFMMYRVHLEPDNDSHSGLESRFSGADRITDEYARSAAGMKDTYPLKYADPLSKLRPGKTLLARISGLMPYWR